METSSHKTQEKQRLEVSSLVLVAVLLSAGFILNLTIGKALSITGIQPEFIISSYCLAILLIRPRISQAVLIGVLAATVIQLTTSIPGLEYVADIPASAVMAALTLIFAKKEKLGVLPFIFTFVTTFVSGLIFASLATTVFLHMPAAAILAMAPVVLGTAFANAFVVQALYNPLSLVVRTRSRQVPAASYTEKEVHSQVETTSDSLYEQNNKPSYEGPAVRLEKVSFSYDQATHPAVHDINLCIETGEFVGIIGPSGAGKSTLAAIMSSAIPHHFRGVFSGACYICGQDSCELEMSEVSRMLGSVLQDIDAQMVASNVEDELLFGLENYGVAHKDIDARISQSLVAVGIEELRHRDIDTLSGGQKQKVAIAAILALQPSVMVLDEPTAALDPASSRAVFSVLRELKQNYGVTIVVIEQKVALLAEFCDRVVVLSEGSIALEGTPREVFSQSKTLRSLGVDCPRVTRISNKLRANDVIKDEVYLTVHEAHQQLKAQLVPYKDKTIHISASGLKQAPLPGESVLKLEGVFFSYEQECETLHDVSFDVKAGELVGIVGQNGAGKTTLTKLMNGLLKPSVGRVVVAGLDTSVERTSTIAQHVSTLFQNPDHQICKNTVLEEVAFSLSLLGIDEGEAFERANKILDYFSLPKDVAPFSLSRGQRQIVALASVIVTRPQLLILDEPTSGLDYRECMTVMQAVSEAQAQGCAVVMVCHDMEVALDFADRLLVMSEGRVRGEGATADVFANKDLMSQAALSAPEVSRLSQALVDDGFTQFKGLSEVSDVASAVEELVRS